MKPCRRDGMDSLMDKNVLLGEGLIQVDVLWKNAVSVPRRTSSSPAAHQHHQTHYRQKYIRFMCRTYNTKGKG